MMCPIILLVAADPLLQHMVRTILKTEGVVTTTATSGTEALWMVSVQQPHMLIVDEHMLDMNCATFSARLRELIGSTTIPTLWLTGNYDMVGVPVMAPHIQVLRKPFSADKLLRLMIELISSPRAHEGDSR